jgi:hypothetical protein
VGSTFAAFAGCDRKRIADETSVWLEEWAGDVAVVDPDDQMIHAIERDARYRA